MSSMLDWDFYKLPRMSDTFDMSHWLDILMQESFVVWAKDMIDDVRKDHSRKVGYIHFDSSIYRSAPNILMEVHCSMIHTPNKTWKFRCVDRWVVQWLLKWFHVAFSINSNHLNGRELLTCWWHCYQAWCRFNTFATGFGANESIHAATIFHQS